MPTPDPTLPVPLAVWLCGQHGDDHAAVRAAICDHALDRYTAPRAPVLLLPADPLLRRVVHAQARTTAVPSRTAARGRTGAALALHLPRQRPTPASLRRTATRALASLRPGGILVTAGGRLHGNGGLGAAVHVVEDTGLAFLQHVIAVRVPVADGHLAAPRRTHREHVDLLVFRKSEL